MPRVDQPQAAIPEIPGVARRQNGVVQTRDGGDLTIEQTDGMPCPPA